jgi:hypothetical protein
MDAASLAAGGDAVTYLVTRLRAWAHAANAVPASDLMDEAAARIESLVKERNHWMRTATAFDEHLATMRVMLMEHPTVRFGAVDDCEAVLLSCGGDFPDPENAADQDIVTLADEEREAIREACDEGRWDPKDYRHIRTLLCLLERLE